MEHEVHDPRDIGWEHSGSAYRVDLWSPDRSRCAEFRLTGASGVRQALAWADDQVRGGGAQQGWSVDLWIEIEDGHDGLGRVLLDGGHDQPT